MLTEEYDDFLLGDRRYPCQRHLLTPYPDAEPGQQQCYNTANSRTRVEMTIEMLKARFQCLCRLRVHPERACDIIGAPDFDGDFFCQAIAFFFFF